MNTKQRLIKFENWVKNKHSSLEELFPTLQKKEAVHINLSENNPTVKTETEFNNPSYFQSKLDDIQLQNQTKIIAGGYLEKRALYTSDIYNLANSTEKRNIHLGVDFWLPEQTPVTSFLNGKIVCAVHQKDYKGYGGFVILEHQMDDVVFYTLYGHLSKKSVEQLATKTRLKKGEQIGVLGNYEENGEWVPHLHFQVMLDLLSYTNDFPGVALESEIEFWKTICPNPNLLFKLKTLF